MKLDGVTVDAKMQETNATSSTYVPSTKQKTAAQNAIDLLRQLAIPQINIDLVNNAVTTLSGEGVAIFVNYAPASTEELNGMKTTDVRRVEFLDFPADPRFRGKEHVVHFIVRKYQYGGYTKASVAEGFLVGKLASEASVFSKFTYKRMTYDLYLGASNYDNKHHGTATTGLYSLKDATMERREDLESTRYKNNEYPVTFRATYSTNKTRVANTLGFTFDRTPRNDASGNILLSTGSDYTYDLSQPSTNRYLVWSGDYYFILPKGFHLSLAPQVRYGHTNYSYTYRETLGSTDIVNTSRENALQLQGNATLFKVIKGGQYVYLTLAGGSTTNDVTYYGTSPYDNDFRDSYASAALGYEYSKNKWNLGVSAAVQWEENKINDQSNSEVYPLINLNAGYSPSNKHSFRANLHFGANYPTTSEKSPNIIRHNELMYYTGNPDIGLSRTLSFNLSYNWMPVNAFSASAFAQYMGEYDLFAPVFHQYDDGKALLRSFDTDCNYHRVKLGLSFNYKLLHGNLQLAASPSVTFYRMTGQYDIRRTPFHCNVSATYYLGNFYFQASYQTRVLGLQGNYGKVVEGRDYYKVLAGWGKSGWNIRLSANNLFRNHWRGSTYELSSPLYSERQWEEGTYFHRRLNLSVTYTIGYGKKVNRGNEVGGQYGTNSAIMK